MLQTTTKELSCSAKKSNLMHFFRRTTSLRATIWNNKWVEVFLKLPLNIHSPGFYEIFMKWLQLNLSWNQSLQKFKCDLVKYLIQLCQPDFFQWWLDSALNFSYHFEKNRNAILFGDCTVWFWKNPIKKMIDWTTSLAKAA